MNDLSIQIDRMGSRGERVREGGVSFLWEGPFEKCKLPDDFLFALFSVRDPRVSPREKCPAQNMKFNFFFRKVRRVLF